MADQTKDLDFFVLQVSGTQLETLGLGYSVYRFLEPRTFGVDVAYHF